MEKRYQVFVSSTYNDLLEERSEVMQALLELECMPAGMELFPAANETQWNWIKKVIDESDYYMVIVAGRYGSISSETKISYTEMEYRYALDSGKPVIAFLHENILKLESGRCESEEKLQGMLDEFRALVKKRLCKMYSTPSDLGAKVSRSITQLKKQYPAKGWIRADILDSLASTDETLRLQRDNEKLRDLVASLSNEGPKDTDHLARGNDEFEVEFFCKRESKHPDTGRFRKAGEGTEVILMTWNEIFQRVAPALIEKRGLHGWKSDVMSGIIDQKSFDYLSKRFPNNRFVEHRVLPECWNTIMMQFRALGLIDIGEDGEWELTRYGDNYYSRIIGVMKGATKALQCQE